MTRVLFIVENGNLDGGTEIQARNLARSLAAKGVECVLFSVVPWNDTHNSDFKKISLTDGQYAELLNTRESFANRLTGVRRESEYLTKCLTEIVDQIKPDWIVNHTYDLADAIPHLPGVKTAQVFHWSIAGYESSLYDLARKKSGLKQTVSMIALRKRFNRLHNAITRFDAIVILTQAATREAKRLFPTVDASKLHIIPNSIPFDKPSEIISPLTDKRMIFVGRLSYEKGVMRLLRIWQQIEAASPDARLDIYGTGDARPEMESFIAANRLRNVTFKGFTRNLTEIYSDASLLAMTSDSEGFGLVLIEAMYFGVPCISFDCPVSPAEIIGDAGIIVPAFSEAIYAGKVIDALNDRSRLLNLQARSLRRAADFFAPAIADRWLQLFAAQ